MSKNTVLEKFWFIDAVKIKNKKYHCFLDFIWNCISCGRSIWSKTLSADLTINSTCFKSCYFCTDVLF